MFSFLHAAHPPRTNKASNNPIFYESGTSSVHFHAPESQYVMTHTLPPQGTAKEGPSILQPPLHYHIHQTEFFQLQKGAANLYMGLDPKPSIALSDVPGAPRTASVPKGRYHRFENASADNELVMDVHLSPESYEDEVRFFRNFFGYLDDCKTHKTQPSFFQLMGFLHSADTPLAIPSPNEMLGKVLSRILLSSANFWGRYVLGYKASYPEYYEPPKTR